jgi:hypothetical protein
MQLHKPPLMIMLCGKDVLEVVHSSLHSNCCWKHNTAEHSLILVVATPRVQGSLMLMVPMHKVAGFVRPHASDPFRFPLHAKSPQARGGHMTR